MVINLLIGFWKTNVDVPMTMARLGVSQDRKIGRNDWLRSSVASAV